ncbi:MAG: hypothetical protein ACKVVP_08555 [Chloroflexota bacterium]
MSEIVAGFASSHSPLMALTGPLWDQFAKQNDPRNRELVKPPHGRHLTFEQMLAEAEPALAGVATVERFEQRVDAIQTALNELSETFAQVNPDVVVMIGDDQNELFYDDNMPSISVYWGDSIPMLPRPVPDSASDANKMYAATYGAEAIDYPVDAKLGLHIIESLMNQDFDVSHSRYLREEYGGKIGPATWYLDFGRETAPRPQGLGHAFAFPIKRWFAGKLPPIVPISINTCYPPNWISPRRAYALGRAVQNAILGWDSNLRVAVATSGGLSHFVVDEELDRQVLNALEECDGDTLSTLPRVRLQSATTEILNWVAVSGMMGDTPMETLAYEPGYRTPAGTGCGCGVGRWL